MTFAALRPGAMVTPDPGWLPAPQRAEFRDRPHGPDLIGQEGAVLVGAVHGADDAPLVIERRLDRASDDAVAQARQEVLGQHVDHGVGVSLLDVVPMGAADTSARVPSHAIGNEMNNELHQRLARRRPARIETRLVDGADHRPARQKPGAGVRESLGEIVERRTADMDVSSLVGRGAGAIGHGCVEREVDAEEGLPPIVALDLAGNRLADLCFAEEIESEVARIDI